MSGLPDDAVLTRIQGLLNQAAKTSHPEEAATFGAKAQELLARHNLTAATVENHQAIKDGRREEAKVEGGTYRYQRDLWRAVAGLNFCLYWTQSYEIHTEAKRVGSGLNRYTTSGWVVRRRHALVGKIVNTRATVAMAGYLQAAIERHLVERLHEEHGDDRAAVNSQRFSKWAVSWRGGAARRVVEKLEDRRRQLTEALAKKQREDAARAERAGASTATAVTLADVTKVEFDANVDFKYGDGTSARWAAERAETAREEREAEEARTRWALENPEEAAAEATRHRASRRTSRGSATRDPVDRSAYWAGYDQADAIGLEQQTDHGSADVRRLGHG